MHITASLQPPADLRIGTHSSLACYLLPVVRCPQLPCTMGTDVGLLLFPPFGCRYQKRRQHDAKEEAMAAVHTLCDGLRRRLFTAVLQARQAGSGLSSAGNTTVGSSASTSTGGEEFDESEHLVSMQQLVTVVGLQAADLCAAVAALHLATHSSGEQLRQLLARGARHRPQQQVQRGSSDLAADSGSESASDTDTEGDEEDGEDEEEEERVAVVCGRSVRRLWGLPWVVASDVLRAMVHTV